MKIVIIGSGKIGYSLAVELAGEDHDIIIVDSSREKVRRVSDSLDVMTVYGNGASIDTQREAGVDSGCDLVIAVTGSDEVNILACILAKKLGCGNTIARVRSREYTEQLYLLKDELGLSMAINPELLAAMEMYRLLQIPAFIKRETFAKGRAEIVELGIDAKSVLCGVRLTDMSRYIKTRMLVCAVLRDGKTLIPDGQFTLCEGDRIFVTAPSSGLVELTHELHLRSKRSKDVMLIGGGKICEHLAPMLLRSGSRLRIIEKDRARSEYLAELFPEATVICADGTNQSVLRLHNAGHMDAVLPVTSIDEENIIISMYLRKLGVPQVLTKINRSEYAEMLGSRGSDSVISPKQISSHEIVRYVRAMENTDGGAVITIHRLADGGAEALEFAVTEETRCIGVPLMDIKLRSGILVACINRMGKIIIPGGRDKLLPGDTVVVVTTAGREVLDLNDVFDRE